MHIMVKLQFGVHKFYQISDAVSACNNRSAQFVIRTKKVGFPCADANPSFVRHTKTLSLVTDFFLISFPDQSQSHSTIYNY
jgi:hypothetical protein